MRDLNAFISAGITEILRSQKRQTEYRPPLVGYAETRNPFFERLKTIVGPAHLLPQDLLPGARSVVSFFLPFTVALVKENQQDLVPAHSWAVAKMETDQAIQAIILEMAERLASMDIRCSANPALEPYDPVKFMHRWSQRHIAYLCGLGSFGLNNLLITELGCAGRLGSFCIDAPTEPGVIREEEACLYKIDGSCGICVKKCPSKALGVGTIDKPACSAWINDFTEKHFRGERAFRSCGKCIALPCAFKRPVRSRHSEEQEEPVQEVDHPHEPHGAAEKP